MKRVKALLIAVCLVVTMVGLPSVASARDFGVGSGLPLYCPLCGHYAYVSIKSFRLATSSSSGTVSFVCSHCGSEYSRTTKYWGSSYRNYRFTLGLFDVISIGYCDNTGLNEDAVISGIFKTCDGNCWFSYVHLGACTWNSSTSLWSSSDPWPESYLSTHRWSESSRIPATCLPGSVKYTCSLCNQTKTESLPANSSAHTWIESSRIPATCLPGSVKYTCSTCKQTKTETLPANPNAHTWKESNRIPATCLPGSIKYTCSTCNQTKTESLPADPTAHTWAETSRTPATCLPGSVEYACSTCQQTKTEPIPALENAHTYEISEIVPAEYDSDGNLVTNSYIIYSCSACGSSYNSSIGGGISGPIIDEGAGGNGMQDSTAAVGKTFLAGVWALFGIYVPGFSFTFGQMWLGFLLCSISILVVRMIFGFGGSRGDSPRTSSTNNPRISEERRHDEF